MNLSKDENWEGQTQMSSEGFQTTCVVTKACKFDFNLCEQDKDMLLSFPLVFPEGPDFEALDYEKFQINSVEVQLKPYDNFTVKNGGRDGYVNGDFPIYLNIYSGNTVGDVAPKTLAQFALRGDYKVGSATSGVKATLNGKWFKTVFFKKPQTTEEIRTSVANKDNGFQTVDDLIAEGDTTILQKGQISIALRLEDFICKSSNIIKAGNIPNDRSKDSSSTHDTAAERILEHLRDKERRLGEPAKEEVKKVKEVKKGKKAVSQEPPTPEYSGVLGDDEEWIETPIQEEGTGKEILKLNYTFWIVCSYNITYWRGLPKA